MDEIRASCSFGGPAGKASVSFFSPPGPSDRIWHSTPVRKKYTSIPRDVSRECGPLCSELDIVARRWSDVTQTPNAYPPNKQQDNMNLNSTVATLTTQAGSHQVRQDELRAMIKQKDQDCSASTSYITALTGRPPGLQMTMTDNYSQENKLVRQMKQIKLRYRDAKLEIMQLKEELQRQVTQSCTQREQMVNLKHKHEQLRQLVVLLVEGDSWKDELLQMAQTKQKHIKLELHRIRQLLHVTVESACESLMKESIQEILGREVSALESLDKMWIDVEEKLALSEVMNKTSKRKLNDTSSFANASEWQSGEVGLLTPEATNEPMTVPELTFGHAMASTLPLGRNSANLFIQSQCKESSRPSSLSGM